MGPVDGSLLPQKRKEIKGVDWTLNRIEEKFIKTANIIFPNEYKEIYLEKMKDPNIIPVAFGNHYDHWNGVSMAIIMKTLTELANTVRDPNNPFKGFLMPVSASLATGKQGMFLKGIFNNVNMDLFITKYHTQMVPCVTKNDIKKRHMTDITNTRLLHEVMRIARNNNGGVCFFPEQTVEGGRRIKEGEFKGHRKGVQEFDSELIDMMTNRLDEELLYFPMGFHGPNLVHTDSGIPTRKFWRGMRNNNPEDLNGIINIQVGKPVTSSELNETIVKEKNGGEITKEDVSKKLRDMLVQLLPSDFLPPKHTQLISYPSGS